jgi:hypothetical protein
MELMSTGDYVCGIGLILGVVLFYYFIRVMRTNVSEDGTVEPPAWLKRLAESQGGEVVRALLALVLGIGLASLVGIVVWETVQGIAETAIAPREVFVAAFVGAVASMVGFALFALVLSLFGPILSAAYEEWVGRIAPVIGGAVGAAISGGLGVSVITIVALSALAGGLTLVLHQAITADKRITFKDVSESAIAGVGFGAVNGLLLAGVFKLLEVTVGIGWMLAG